MKNKGKAVSITITIYLIFILLICASLFLGIVKPLTMGILEIVENIFY